MSTDKALTGGTGDVNPQQVLLNAKQDNAIDADTLVNFSLPQAIGIPTTKTRAVVFELLRGDVVFTPGFNLGEVAGVTLTMNMAIGSPPQPITPEQAVVIWSGNRTKYTAAAGGGPINRFIEKDFTDDSGHGLLIAARTVSIQISSVGTLQENTAHVRLYYRFKLIPLQEYLGIFAQQAAVSG